jgi:hypothetical protein
VLLNAKLDALRLDSEELAIRLEALSDQEEEQEEEPTRDPDADARWLKGARRELAELIREIEGPRPQPAPRRKAPGRRS